jgi:Phage tail protein (Tail_P2_I)
MDSLLPSSVQDTRFLSLEAIVNRLGSLPIETVLVKHIDTVHPSALIHLAEEFNVLGRRGWALCETDEQRRNLIKRAIALHRYAGTPWAIQSALEAVGFPNAEIEENPPATYSGTIGYDGFDDYGGQLWGGFKVFLDISQRPLLASAQLRLIRDLILEWKNARSHLVGIGFRLSTFNYSGYPIYYYDGAMLFNGDRTYNNYSVFFDGTQNYDGTLDTGTIQPEFL